MPYWDAVYEGPEQTDTWEGVNLYCDLETHDTVAQIEEDTTGWCAYRWTETGDQCQTAETTNELWWVLDDLLWGPLYWWGYHADGRELTVAEDRIARGFPADDLLYDLAMAELKTLRPERPA